jgi:ABC-type branched-subunit amino acid transport system substrate-binding protein
MIAGAEEPIASLVEEREVPLIGPSTINPATAFPLNRQVFYLYSGIKEQCGALLDFFRTKASGDKPRMAFLFPDDPASKEICRSLTEQAKKNGQTTVIELAYSKSRFNSQALAKELLKSEVDALLFLGPGDEAAALLSDVAAVTARVPIVLMPGVLAGKAALSLPASYKGKVFLSFPTLPTDQKPAVLNEHAELARKYRLPSRNVAAQMSSLAAAKIFVEALKLAGREVSREKLIRVLEGFYEIQTGITPPITFGPNRRIGALGAYVVSVDIENRQFIPASGWIKPE